MVRYRRSLAPVLLVAALLALPIVPLAAPPAAAATGGGLLEATFPGLPAALSASWPARSGFSSSYLAETTGLVASDQPNVSIMVTLWPRSVSFFDPVPGAAPLTAAQVRSEYGPTPSDYEALVAYFTARGLSVLHAWPDDLSITFTGPAAAVGSAFGTELANGTWEGRSVRLPLSSPVLPAAIEAEISSVSGLSDGFTTFTVPFSSASTVAALPGRTTTLLWPSAVHGLYGLDGLYNYSGSAHWATGIGIALVLWGEGYAPADIQGFFANYYPSSFPPIQYAGYPVDGAPAPSANAVNDPSNVTSEMTLDMEWAGSAAPGATLSAVYAPDGPARNGYSPSDVALEDALSLAAQSLSGVRVISMSFGTPDGSDPSFQAAFTQLLADAQARGITVLAASGDTGGTAKLGCSGGFVAEFPAASDYVVAVGGTAPVLSVDTLGAVTGLAAEPAWNRSGGGFSTTVQAPPWQEVGSAAAPIRADGHRGLPDVAGPASDNVFFYDGQEAAGAGTSFASPMWGGIVAEMDAIRGTPLGFVTPRLYAVGAAEANRTTAIGLVDITQGGNCLGSAASGWDTATGWGSPRAGTLYQDLSGTFVNVSLTVSTLTVAPGQSFDATVLVTNATSLAPVTGAAVSFSLDSVNYVGPCGGSVASATGATSSGGSATSSLTVPGCYLGLSLQVTATVSGGRYFGSNQTTVRVNLIGLAGFLAVVQVFPYNLITFVAIMAASVAIGWRIGTARDPRRRRGATAPPSGSAPSAPPGAVSPAPLSPSVPSSGLGPPSTSATTPAAGVPLRAEPPKSAAAAPVATSPSPIAATSPRSISPAVPKGRPTSRPPTAGPRPRTAGAASVSGAARPRPSAVASPPLAPSRKTVPPDASPAPANSSTPPEAVPALAPAAEHSTPTPPPASAAPVRPSACPVCQAQIFPGTETCAVCGAPLP